MNKKIYNKLIVFVLILVIGFNVSACNDKKEKVVVNRPKKITYKDGDDKHFLVRKAKGRLVYIPAYSMIDSDYILDSLDSDKIFLKAGEKKVTTGRYANKTKDGKFDWTDEEIIFFDKNKRKKDILKKVKIGGSRIKLPCKFKDFGKEYAVFDKIDFKKLTNKEIPFTIIDKKTKNRITVFSDIYEYVKSNRKTFNLNLLDKNNKPILFLDFNINKNHIYGVNIDINNEFLPNSSVAGLRIGNTLNEVYDKFGKPWSKDGDSIGYLYIYNGNNIVVNFTGNGKLYIPKKETKIVKNNIVTRIDIYLVGGKDSE
ncbi:MAG: hypothetical protein CSB15_01390 [Clostridiales bacterium]|nr:MAG: hypothetical protein CSB15_01390 [Clostridiales bacterium]